MQLHGRSLILLLVLASAISMSPAANGQVDFTWQGDNNDNWGNGGNWDQTPGSGDIPNADDHDVTFNNTADRFTVDLQGNSRTVRNMVVAGFSTQTYTFYNGTLRLDSLLIGNSGGPAHQFDVDIQQYASGTWSRGLTDRKVDINGVLSGTSDLLIDTDTIKIFRFNNANTYSGTLTVEGIIELGHADALQNAKVVLTQNNGIDVSTQTVDANLGSLAGTGDLDVGTTTMTVGANDRSTTFSGKLSGSGAFRKTGAGTLTLSGDLTGLGTLHSAGTGTTEITTGGVWGEINANIGLLDIRDSASVELTGNVTNAFFIRNGADVFIREGAEVSITGAGSPRVVLINDSLLNANGAGSTLAAPRIAVGPSGSGSNLFFVQNQAAVTTPLFQVGDLGADDGASGSAVVSSGGTLTAHVIQLYLRGSLSVSGGQVVADQIVNVNSTEAIKISDGTPGAALVLGGDGSNSTIDKVIQDNVAGAGSIRKTGAGTLVLTGENTFTGGVTVADGTLRASNTSGSATGTGNVRVNAGAMLLGTGSIAGSVIVDAGAVLAPGDSTGTLQVGSVGLAPGATFAVAIGPAQFSSLAAISGGQFGGTLDIQLLDNFAPTLGDSFEILSASSSGLAGKFDTIVGRQIDESLQFDVLYSPSAVTLKVVSVPLGGDYNDDGIVDLADYAVWRDNLGAAAGTLANDTDGGTIGVSQYATWKANFGDASGMSTTSASSTVPEPGAWLLLTLLAAASAGGLRRTNCG